MKRKKVDDKGKQFSSLNGKTPLDHIYLTESTIARRLGMEMISFYWCLKRYTGSLPVYSLPWPRRFRRTWATNERLVLAWEAERARRQAARAAAKQQRQGDRVK